MLQLTWLILNWKLKKIYLLCVSIIMRALNHAFRIKICWREVKFWACATCQGSWYYVCVSRRQPWWYTWKNVKGEKKEDEESNSRFRIWEKGRRSIRRHSYISVRCSFNHQLQICLHLVIPSYKVHSKSGTKVVYTESIKLLLAKSFSFRIPFA